MPEEQLKAFLEVVKADEALQEKLKAAGDADAVVAIAKGVGFAISVEELAKAQTELSDEQLDSVAGGASGVGWCFISVASLILCDEEFSYRDEIINLR